MSSTVSVKQQDVSMAITICQTAIQSFQKSAGALEKAKKSSNWKDSKFSAASAKIETCKEALNRPITDLNKCITSLEKLLQAISEYENVNI